MNTLIKEQDFMIAVDNETILQGDINDIREAIEIILFSSTMDQDLKAKRLIKLGENPLQFGIN